MLATRRYHCARAAARSWLPRPITSPNSKLPPSANTSFARSCVNKLKALHSLRHGTVAKAAPVGVHAATTASSYQCPRITKTRAEVGNWCQHSSTSDLRTSDEGNQRPQLQNLHRWSNQTNTHCEGSSGRYLPTKTVARRRNSTQNQHGLAPVSHMPHRMWHILALRGMCCRLWLPK